MQFFFKSLFLLVTLLRNSLYQFQPFETFKCPFISVPPESPIILDKWGRHLNGSVGPHEVGEDLILTCRTVGGHPKPSVRWLVNGVVVDDEYEHDAGDVIENKLTWPSMSRKDLDAIFTCQAQNTLLTQPKDAAVLLQLICKFLPALKPHYQ